MVFAELTVWSKKKHCLLYIIPENLYALVKHKWDAGKSLAFSSTHTTTWSGAARTHTKKRRLKKTSWGRYTASMKAVGPQ